MAADIAEVPAAGIEKLLQDNRFVVPNHQRDYSWTEHEVNQLFDDIADALERGFPEYFLGLMVFMHGANGTLVVLDGQQRLVTTVLLLAAIRDWLRQYSDYAEDASSVQEQFIGRREFGEKHTTPNLTLNAANNPAFESYVVTSVAIDDVVSVRAALKPQDRNRRLLDATVFAHQLIRGVVERHENADDAAKYLFRLLTYVRDKASVVRLTVSSEGAAFTIFETLNDRGLDLSPLDLVKNYLFSKADNPTGMRDLEARWTQMMAALANVKPDKFLAAFWTSRHGRIRSADLYESFKRQYQSADSVVECSIDMIEAAEQYAALEAPDDPVWAPFGTEARQRIRSLSIIGSQSTHPVLLAALKKMPVHEIERLLRLLEVFLVRYQLILSGNPGRLGTTCAIVARDIFAGKILTATAAFEAVREIYPSDTEFKTAFRNKAGMSNQKAQYVLRTLEIEARRLTKGAMARELEPGAITVEHILPRNAAEEWAEVISIDSTVAEECSERLGNLCLLTHVNRELGRKSFPEKKLEYAKSDLEITKEIATHDEWSRETIDRRQATMAKLAAQAWRFQ